MDFIPYGRQFIDDDDIASVVDVLKSPFLTTGPKIEEFENEICNQTGASYAVALANGTAALHLASLTLLSKGDIVLTTPNSFLATSNSILYVGATPKFIDICEDGNIDLDLCEQELKKNNKIKVLYVVHFSGNPINQNKLKHLKETYNIKILEDCAHSLGASFDGIKAGSCQNSDCSILSFHPVKHITTGEGGAITTNNYETYQRLLSLRGHGMVKSLNMKPWEYEMRELGFNYRLSDFGCALGISQFKKLDNFIKRRHEIAKIYNEAFLNTVVKPLYPFNKNSSYHLFVVMVDFRKLTITKEKLFFKMKEANIGLQLHYIPINKQPYYKSLGYGNEITPVMDKYYEQCFSLPMFPSLKIDEQNYVISTILELLNEK